MSFWESQLGEITGSAQDAFAKDAFVIIPNGTMALARIGAFINAEYQGNKYLSIDWILTDGEFKDQKVNQKLKVYGDPLARDIAKAKHRALNMLKLIYQLFNVKPKHPGEPTDQDLSVFVGKIAGIKIRETEPNDDGKQYNWVSEVHPASGFKCETGTKVEVVHIRSSVDTAFSRNEQPADILDDLPF
jgi:hypothetical protein